MLRTHGDGIHEVAIDRDGKLERIAQFDWESVRHNVDGESIDEGTVTFSDMTASFSLLLQWACKSNSLTNVGARVASLLC
jgi:hypothetical protein